MALYISKFIELDENESIYESLSSLWKDLEMKRFILNFELNQFCLSFDNVNETVQTIDLLLESYGPDQSIEKSRIGILKCQYARSGKLDRDMITIHCQSEIDFLEQLTSKKMEWKLNIYNLLAMYYCEMAISKNEYDTYENSYFMKAIKCWDSVFEQVPCYYRGIKKKSSPIDNISDLNNYFGTYDIFMRRFS